MTRKWGRIVGLALALRVIRSTIFADPTSLTILRHVAYYRPEESHGFDNLDVDECVTTSARPDSRCRQGFGDFLRSLALNPILAIA